MNCQPPSRAMLTHKAGSSRGKLRRHKIGMTVLIATAQFPHSLDRARAKELRITVADAYAAVGVVHKSVQINAELVSAAHAS